MGYHKDGKFNVFIHADASKKDEIKEWAQTIGSKASEHVGNTVVFDPKGDESRLKGFFGFADSVEVSVGLVDLQNSKKKFVMEESADLEKTLAFIAKMDGTENEIMDDRFDVRGYPALFFMNSEGKVESYNGGRTLDDMLKYIEEHKTPVSED